jgi:hypothetical protein
MLHNILEFWQFPLEMGATTSIIQGQINSIQKSIDYLNKYPSDSSSAELLTRYIILQTEMNQTLLNSSTLSPEILSTRQREYETSMSQLDFEKASIQRSISPDSAAAYYYKQFTYYLGMLFAIIIITNKMITFDNFSLYKFINLSFYAVWGAVFYPFVLLWGVYDPPRWSASLIPFFKDTEYTLFTPLIFPYRFSDYTAIVTQLDPNKPIKTDSSKNILRVFTCIIIALLLIGQSIPASITA